jgi:hypothetical protein
MFVSTQQNEEEEEHVRWRVGTTNINKERR